MDDSNVFLLTSFKVKKEPTVTEVEVSVVSILLHQLKQFRVQDLSMENQRITMSVCQTLYIDTT